MSECNNETSKICPDLHPMQHNSHKAYHLKKITEIEAYLLDEIEVHEYLQKR